MRVKDLHLNVKMVLLFFTMILIIYTFSSQSVSTTSPTNGYIEIKGDKFYKNGELFILKGFNYFPRNSLRQSMTLWNWSEVDEELRKAKSLGANVVRTFIDYGFSVEHESVKFDSITITQKKYITKNYIAAIDSFLLIAENRQLKVIFSIFDFMPGWAFLKTENRDKYIQYAHDYLNDLLINKGLKDRSTIIAWDILNAFAQDNSVLGFLNFDHLNFDIV